MYQCTQCNKLFGSAGKLQGHPCVTAARKLPRDQLLARLLASGGCSQQYYDAEMAKLQK